jgi:rRNA maturation endonuclease Nob1
MIKHNKTTKSEKSNTKIYKYFILCKKCEEYFHTDNAVCPNCGYKTDLKKYKKEFEVKPCAENDFGI